MAGQVLKKYTARLLKYLSCYFGHKFVFVRAVTLDTYTAQLEPFGSKDVGLYYCKRCGGMYYRFGYPGSMSNPERYEKVKHEYS